MTADEAALRAFDAIAGPALVPWFAVLMIAEARWPLRRRVEAWVPHVARNAASGSFAALVARLAVLPVLVTVAARAERDGFGVARWIGGPKVAAGVVAFLLLDWSMYGWHRLNHVVPLLWRFHRVHHVDLDLDASTALRFHAGELLFSIVFRSAQVALVGASPALLVGYEVTVQAATALHHANLRLPPRVDAWLMRLVVTPRMHGLHHAVDPTLQGANWSVVLSAWDRLHRSLRAPTAHADSPRGGMAGEGRLAIGVAELRDPAAVGLVRLLLLPFRRTRQEPS
jgi:sterol desaturase/sphingolipid hydroxylase (fatty acid hydroxylase superfamily)